MADDHNEVICCLCSPTPFSMQWLMALSKTSLVKVKAALWNLPHSWSQVLSFYRVTGWMKALNLALGPFCKISPVRGFQDTLTLHFLTYIRNCKWSISVWTCTEILPGHHGIGEQQMTLSVIRIQDPRGQDQCRVHRHDSLSPMDKYSHATTWRRFFFRGIPWLLKNQGQGLKLFITCTQTLLRHRMTPRSSLHGGGESERERGDGK